MNGPIEDTNDPENPAAPGGRAISRRGEEARGGFVLRAKSDETPHRRRSLVERSGMKTLVQVSKSSFFFYIFLTVPIFFIVVISRSSHERTNSYQNFS